MLWTDIEYREQVPADSDQEEWIWHGRVPQDGRPIKIDSLQLGAGYDIRLRTFDDETKLFSDWTQRTGKTPARPANRIPAVSGVRSTSAGCLSWRQDEQPASVIGYEIRHAAGDVTEWGQMEPAHDGLISGSPWPLCEVPGGQRTIAVRSVDEWGNLSDPTFGSVYVRDLDNANEYTDQLDDHRSLGWPGVIVNGTVDGGGDLIADQVPGSSDLAPFWDSSNPLLTLPDDQRPFWTSDSDAFWDWSYLDMTYEAVITIGTWSPDVRLTFGVDVLDTNSPVLLDYQTDYDPTWKPWPGQLDGPPVGVYTFRVSLRGGVNQPRLTELTARVSSVPDVPAMKWRGIWFSGEYRASDVVRDGDWTMIANKDTFDRPAPQLLEDLRWLISPEPTWNQSSLSATILETGQRYTFSIDAVVASIQVYIPSSLLNYEYALVINNNTTGESGSVPVPNPGAAGWTPAPISTNLALAGEEWDVALRVTDPAGAAVFSGPWNYTIGSSSQTPLAGEAYERTNGTIRFSKTDAAAGDRTAELEGVVVGTDIAALGRGWTVTGITIDPTFVEYNVTPSGEALPAGLQSFTFTVPVSLPLPYVDAPGFWTGWADNPDVEGIISGDGAPYATSDTAFGVDILVADAAISKDWEVVAFSSVGGSGASKAGTVLVSTNYTPARSDKTILVDATLSDVTITVPDFDEGHELTVKRRDSSAFAVELVTPTLARIDDAPSLTLDNQFDGAHITRIDGDWWVS